MSDEDLFGDMDSQVLENLPEIGREDTFCFQCGPDEPCFNRCCAELTLPLTPYDVMRLSRNLQLASDELLRTFTQLRSFPETGFPLFLLRMIESPDAPCPFVTPAGCSVYDDRPGACRCYPLGRGTRVTKDGIAERFFLVREDHCKGFDNSAGKTPAQWFASQGLEKYNYFNDRYMRLMSLVRASGKPLDTRMANMCALCLFQLDKFRELVQKMGIFSHVDMDERRKKLIMETSLAADEACLEFALDWMELIIFGKAKYLKRKTN